MPASTSQVATAKPTPITAYNPLNNNGKRISMREKPILCSVGGRAVSLS